MLTILKNSISLGNGISLYKNTISLYNDTVYCGNIKTGGLTFAGESKPRWNNGLWLQTSNQEDAGFALKDQKNNLIVFHYSNSTKQIHFNNVGYIGISGGWRGQNCVYRFSAYATRTAYYAWIAQGVCVTVSGSTPSGYNLSGGNYLWSWNPS